LESNAKVTNRLFKPPYIAKLMNLLIKNGTLVTAEKTEKADILVSGEKIERVAPEIKQVQGAVREIDATGRLVIPGGLDPHVHMHLPTPAGFSADDFESGSRAALIGGTTTMIDFVTPRKGQQLTQALDERLAEASSSLIDFSLHVSPVEWHQKLEDEITNCLKRGIRSFKVYMAYLETIGLTDDVLEKVLAILGKHGAMLTVHAEVGAEIERLRNGFFESGKTEPLFHALSRPPHTEAEAVKKVLAMAKKANCQVYLVHISAAASLSHIEAAQSDGQHVFAETCPQYLLLNDLAYDKKLERALPFVMSPPLRKKVDNEALWKALAKGTIQSTGTDHCPFNLEQKLLGKDDFRKIPNGAGGVEHRLALLYTFGVREKRISLNRWVDICSATPAKIFGLFPRKGSLEPGTDADIVIWNPEIRQTISAKTHHQRCNINVFEGVKTIGGPEYVIAAGKLAVQKGALSNEGLKGRFLKQC